MKKFGSRIVIFSMPAVLFLALTAIFYYSSKIKINSEFGEISTYKCLLMGDSQIQRLNGELISKRTKNLANSGEHYYFTYNKLLSIVKNDSCQVDKVILGMSIHNFAPVYNRFLNLNFREGRNSLKRYLYFIRLWKDRSVFGEFSQLFDMEIISGVYFPPEWGGFIASNVSNPSSEIVDKTFNMHFSIMENEDKFCHSQKTYLQKIDELCTDNNIDLVLISTPYHLDYKRKIATEYYEYFSEILRDFNHRCHVNYLSDTIDPSLMSDANHLNNRGATYYSKNISKEINNGKCKQVGANSQF